MLSVVTFFTVTTLELSQLHSKNNFILTLYNTNALIFMQNFKQGKDGSYFYYP